MNEQGVYCIVGLQEGGHPILPRQVCKGQGVFRCAVEFASRQSREREQLGLPRYHQSLALVDFCRVSFGWLYLAFYMLSQGEITE